MGVLECEEQKGRSYANTYNPDGTNRVVATRNFIVRADNPLEGPRSILSTTGLPDPGEAHPEDPTIFARSGIAKQRTDAWSYWDATFTYDDEATREQPQGQWPNQDPTQQPITVEYGFERYTRLASGLGTWNPTTKKWSIGILNSAGQPFEPQPEVDASRPTFTFVENKSDADFDWAFLEDYQDAVNENPIWGKAARTLKMQMLSAGVLQTVKINQNNDTVKYRVVTYMIQYDVNTWDIKPVQQGEFTRVDPNDPTEQISVTQSGDLYYFNDGGGNPVNQLLTQEQTPGQYDGEFLPFGSEPVYAEIRGYVEKDFSLLNLPNPYA